MTPLVKVLKRASEKLLGKWSEGPELPRRYEQIVEAFARTTTSTDRWQGFALDLARCAWRDAYERGATYAERLDEHGPELRDPDVVAALLRDEWEMPEFDPGEGLVVPEANELPIELPRGESDAVMESMQRSYVASQIARGPCR